MVSPPSWTSVWCRPQSRMRFVEIGRSAVRPGADVVGVKVRGGMAARELAYALVADPEGATLGTGGKAFRTAQAQHVAPARHECALDPCRTQQALRRGGLDRTMTLDEARTSLDRRSRGNVAGRGGERSRGNVQSLGVDVDDHDGVVVGGLAGPRLEVVGGEVDQGLDAVETGERTRFTCRQRVIRPRRALGHRTCRSFDGCIDQGRLFRGQHDADPYHPVTRRL